MDSQARRRMQGFSAALLTVVLLAQPLIARADEKIEFHIETGDAASTLTEFGRQAQLQILYNYTLVKGRMTHAVNGVYRPSDALREMLADTGLGFAFVNSRTLTVTPLGNTANGSSEFPGKRSEPGQSTPRHARSQRPDTMKPSPDTGNIPMEEVRITGTNLRGESPVGAQVITRTRKDIEESGAATVGGFLRTLPQTFGGGPTQDTHIGAEARTNSGLGTGVNLRGLDAGSTLVLINGRRLAPGGSEAAFVDVENIPLAAVERIDVLPDSASAMYGADAVGGVVNFVMRESFSGAETIARAGSGTGSALEEYQLAQTLGREWDSGGGLISVEFYRRGALPAQDRSYAVSDLRPFGGGDFDTNLTNPGNIVIGAQRWAIPAGQDGTHLTPSDLAPGTANRQNIYSGADLIPSQLRWSLYGTGRQDLGERVTLFSDVLLSSREPTERLGGLRAAITVPNINPFYVNPAGGTAPIAVAYDFARDLGRRTAENHVTTANATLGLDIEAGGSWTVSAYGTYARERQSQTTANQVNFTALAAALADPDRATAFNPFGDGSHTNPATLAAIRTSARFLASSELKMANVTADGPIGQAPGGALKLAVGVEHRNQFFETFVSANGLVPAAAENLSRQITAAFGELIAPIFSVHNSRPGLRKLELSLAGRFEEFSRFGHATTPKYGLAWSPWQGLALRATWARSVRVPTLTNLDENQNVVTSPTLPDSTSPQTGTRTLVWGGNNAALREEHAESWTLGLDLTPRQLPGLSIGLTYFAIAFQDRIHNPAFSATILNDPRYAPIVTRNPSATLIDYVCRHALYFSGTTADCINLPVGAIVDLRLRNSAMLLTHGVDFNGRYEREAARGKLRFALDGTWLMGFSLADQPNSPLTSLLNTQNNPVNLRLRGSLGWDRGRFGLTGVINFTNNYHDSASQPNRTVASWTTIDAQLRYDIPAHDRSWLENTRLELNVENLFNVSPPFLNNQIVGLGYDQENADPYGRMVSFALRKNW